MDERFFTEAEGILRLSEYRLITATGGGGKVSFLCAASPKRNILGTVSR